jgi:hypothetical protein
MAKNIEIPKGCPCTLDSIAAHLKQGLVEKATINMKRNWIEVNVAEGNGESDRVTVVLRGGKVVIGAPLPLGIVLGFSIGQIVVAMFSMLAVNVVVGGLALVVMYAIFMPFASAHWTPSAELVKQKTQELLVSGGPKGVRNNPNTPAEANNTVFIDTDALGLPPFYGILPTLPVWSGGNTVLTCTPMSGYPFPTNHTIQWSVSGTDLPGHLLVGQAGVFAPRSDGPNTNDSTSFTLIETCMFDQATAGAATLDPAVTYVFGVTALVASNSPASNVSLTLPNSSVAELWEDSLVPKSFLWTEGITAPASFDATFPSGNYVFNLHGTAPTERVTLNFPSGLIQPNAPHVNNFAAAQTVNPALPFLLSWDPFQGAGTADIVAVTIGDHPVFTMVPPGGGSGTLNGTSTSVLIPAGTLQPNGHYDATILFERFKGTNNSTNLTVVIRATITRFVLTTTNSTYVVSGVGVRTTRFGFTITGASGMIVAVEACTNLASPAWAPLRTNTLINGWFYFSDPQWTNYPGRFYRLRSP